MDTQKSHNIVLAAKKLLEDKKLIAAYLRGEITKDVLDERGIKLAMPV